MIKWSYWGPKLKGRKRNYWRTSRQCKTNNRRLIKWAKAKEGRKEIHDICDDYYYWIARQCWEELHYSSFTNYENYYNTKYQKY